MAEPTPLSSFFFQNDPNINAELRKRIALQMMASQGKFPKTIGEGLSAIGDAIGDRGIAYQLGQQDLAMQGLNPPAAGATGPQAYSNVRIQDEPGVQAITAASGPSISPVAPSAIAQQQPRPASLPPAQNQVVAPGATPAEGGFNELDAAGAADPTFARQRAIGGIESGGSRNPYATLGAVTPSGDRAYGRYQVMGANIGPWTQAALGRSLTPQQFLADRDAQDATFNKQFGGYADKYGEEGAAKAWYAGERGMNNPNATDQHGRLTVAGYGQDYINRLGGGDPRSAITAQMMALAPTGAGGGPGGQPAPPAPVQVAQAQLQPRNPQRTVNDIQPAPAQQQYPPGYVPPPAERPQGAPVIQPTPREVELSTWAAQQAARGNPYAAAKVAAELGALQKNREIRQNEANKYYEAQVARGTTLEAERTKGMMDQPKRQVEVAKEQQALADAKEKSILQSRFGGREPAAMFTEFDKEKDSAAKTVNAINQYATVRDMFDKGVITGTGQGWKVSAAKVAAAFGITSAGDAVARTEQMQAALQSTLGLAIDTIQGSGQKVSDADMKMASGTIGGDPGMQEKAIRGIVARAEKIARSKLNEYEDQRDYYFGGTNAERRYQMPVPETAPQPHVETLLKNRSDDAAKAEFDQRFGPGAADLEIARAKRRERRGG